MTYQPYLIANYSTGLDKREQPWMIPDEAQQDLFDGYVYRGTMTKREGYKYLAIGGGAVPYRESRIIHTLAAVSMSGTINGTNHVFTLAGHTQIARGSITITGSNPPQSFTDNGLGFFFNGITQIGTVNYVTGAISITLPAAPTSGTVHITYSFMPGNPVMMVANFITALNVKQLVVADTQYVNLYDTSANVLVDISPSAAYLGNNFNFFTWVNYPDANFNPRLLFANNAAGDVIQQFDGTTVTPYSYTMVTSAASPVSVTTLNCLDMVQMKDRLLLLNTTENGTTYGKRIRISGTGANSDVFLTSATGAGFIDIPDDSWIQGSSFNRDDLLIFTANSTWVLKYTGNDTTPFVLNQIDETRGSDAPFSIFTYLNRTTAVSKRGLIISDGYRVERQDMLIPDFTTTEVDNLNFALCFSGVVDRDRDHYLIYPTSGESTSMRILVTNYDEDNYCTYRYPLSSMGTFQSAIVINWTSLVYNATTGAGYQTWDQLALDYGTWNSFAFNKGEPFTVGGGQNGEIWQLAVANLEDNPVHIYNITVINATTIEVTTDFNNFSVNDDDNTLGKDFIYFTGVGGMQEINKQQFPITSISNANTFQVDVGTAIVPATSFTAYTSAGRCSRVIPFSSTMKKFNPFIEQDKKVRCGWLYMYVDTTGTDLQRNIMISGIAQSDPCVITTNVNHNINTNDEVFIFGVGGMTELNGIKSYATVLSPTSFSIPIDSFGFTPYTSGGYIGVAVNAVLSIDIITNDNAAADLKDNVPNPYQGTLSNINLETGSKKWYKVFVNQVGRFIQFRFRSQQAGAVVNIQATMPGFAPVGRLI